MPKRGEIPSKREKNIDQKEKSVFLYLDMNMKE
jgi:hypothetical protein